MDRSPRDLLESIRELSRLLVNDEGLDAALGRIAGLACRFMPACSMAGITMRQGDRFTTPVCTDPTVAEVDEVQYATGAGPCVQAERDGRIYRIDSTREDTRWPEFAAAAANAGIASTLSLPMMADSQAVGALNLYSPERSGFADIDEEAALLFAEQAALAYLHAERSWRTVEVTEHLQEALKSRDVIGQAKGVIMARAGITADAAFEILRQESQRRNVKLRDLAEQVALTGEVPKT